MGPWHWYYFFLVKKTLYFRAVLGSYQNWAKGLASSLDISFPDTGTAPQSAYPAVPLLQCVNLDWHIIITQSPQPTLGLTHGVVRMPHDTYQPFCTV